jgi:Zn-dependent M28 family amino/carboxypeptidase
MARIPYEAGVQIVAGGLSRARLAMVNVERKGYSSNVIGETRGAGRGAEIVVVCGHYDSHMGISGAADNAGGTAVMMELARALARAPGRRTLRFIGFSGEEVGLRGSALYAGELSKNAARATELNRHRLCVNLDVHGTIFGSNTAFYIGAEDLGSSARTLARETRFPLTVSRSLLASDGTSLAAVGVPAFQIGRGGGPAGHTTRDVMRYLSPQVFEEMGRFVERYLRRYALEAGVFPFAREIPSDQAEEIRSYLEKSGLAMPQAATRRSRAGRSAQRGTGGRPSRKKALGLS